MRCRRCASWSTGWPTLGAGAGEAVPPDLGPGVVMDQLAVVVYDASAAPGCDAGSLTAELADLRRRLA